MTESETAALTHALIAYYRPEGLLRGSCSVRWGNSATQLGRAQYPSGISGKRPTITYSRPLWAAMPEHEHEQRDTVIHEVAHLLTIDDYLRTHYLRTPGAPRTLPHGREWQAWMRRMGGQTRATCKDPHVATAGRAILAARAQRRGDAVLMHCGCATPPHTLTARRALRPSICLTCRQPLRGTGYEGLAALLVRAAEGLHTDLPDSVAILGSRMRGWPARSVLAMAREIYADVPQAERVRLGLEPE